MNSPPIGKGSAFAPCRVERKPTGARSGGDVFHRFTRPRMSPGFRRAIPSISIGLIHDPSMHSIIYEFIQVRFMRQAAPVGEAKHVRSPSRRHCGENIVLEKRPMENKTDSRGRYAVSLESASKGEDKRNVRFENAARQNRNLHILGVTDGALRRINWLRYPTILRHSGAVRV
jgi:hypothetical protein